MVRGNFQRRIELAQSRKEQAALKKQSKVDERRLLSLIKKAGLKEVVHVWLRGDDDVCTYSFYQRVVCTDRKCRKSHTILPLCEAVEDDSVCKRIVKQDKEKKGSSSKGRLMLGEHIELLDDNAKLAFKLPSLSSVIYVVIGGKVVYSDEDGFAEETSPPNPPPVQSSLPTPPPPPTTKTPEPPQSPKANVRNPLLLLPEDVIIQVCSFVHFRHYGLIALTCKELYSRCFNPSTIRNLDKVLRFNIIPRDPTLNTDQKCLNMIRNLLLDTRNLAILQSLPNHLTDTKHHSNSTFDLGPNASGAVLLDEFTVARVIREDQEKKNFGTHLSIANLPCNLSRTQPSIRVAPRKKKYQVECFGATANFLVSLSESEIVDTPKPILNILKKTDAIECLEGVDTTTPAIDLRSFLCKEYDRNPELAYISAKEGANDGVDEDRKRKPQRSIQFLDCCALPNRTQVTPWPAAGSDAFILNIVCMWGSILERSEGEEGTAQNTESIILSRTFDSILFSYSQPFGGIGELKLVGRLSGHHLYDESLVLPVPANRSYLKEYNLPETGEIEQDVRKQIGEKYLFMWSSSIPIFTTKTGIELFYEGRVMGREYRLICGVVDDVFYIRNPSLNKYEMLGDVENSVRTMAEGKKFQHVDNDDFKTEPEVRYEFISKNRRVAIRCTGLGICHGFELQYKLGDGTWVTLPEQQMNIASPDRDLMITNINLEIKNGTWLVVYSSCGRTDDGNPKGMCIYGDKTSLGVLGKEGEKVDGDNDGDKKKKMKKKKKRLASKTVGKKDNFARGMSLRG